MPEGHSIRTHKPDSTFNEIRHFRQLARDGGGVAPIGLSGEEVSSISPTVDAYRLALYLTYARLPLTMTERDFALETLNDDTIRRSEDAAIKECARLAAVAVNKAAGEQKVGGMLGPAAREALCAKGDVNNSLARTDRARAERSERIIQLETLVGGMFGTGRIHPNWDWMCSQQERPAFQHADGTPVELGVQPRYDVGNIDVKLAFLATDVLERRQAGRMQTCEESLPEPRMATLSDASSYHSYDAPELVPVGTKREDFFRTFRHRCCI